MAKQIKSDHKIEVFDCISPGENSYGHAEALDILIEKVDSEYCLVTDCDIVYLCHHWDKIMMEKLQDNVVIVGSEYDSMRNENNVSKPRKYENFPNVVTSLFKTQAIKDCNISFMPGHMVSTGPSTFNERKIEIDESNQHIYGNKIGEVMDLDTGWQICKNLKSNGYDGIAMNLKRRSAGDNCIFLEENTRGEEYWVDGKVMTSHAGRSFVRNLETHPKAQGWLSNVNNWFSNMKHMQ